MLWLIPIVLIFGFLKSTVFKGWLGEKLVSSKASRRLPEGDYFQFNDVTIPDGVGSTQIDHIYVSRFGIFVVETKNMNGWIFGRADQSQWTQTLYKKKYKFQNPIRQNYKHVKTLESILRVPASKLHTVIVFTGDSTFKTELPQCVCKLSNFVDYIASFRDHLLTQDEVSEICRKIETSRLERSRSTHSAHVQYLRNKHGK